MWIFAKEFILDFYSGWKDATHIQIDLLCICLLRDFAHYRGLIRSYMT